MVSTLRSLQVIASPRMGGAETTFLRTAHALHAAGHPVLAAVRRGSDLERHLEDRLPYERFTMRNYVDLASMVKIRQAAERSEADVVQSWASRATWLTRAPEGVAHVARLGGYYKLRYFRHADAWIVNTRRMREWMVAKGFPPDRVEWINTFVPPLPPGTAPALGREQLGIPAEALVVIALGRFIEKKGFEDLIAAFAHLPAAIGQRPLHLVLVGDGPLLQPLRSAAASVQDRVHFTGWLDQPLPLLSVADVFVCPSRVEPLGNVVLEAWSQGVAVVCTETDGGTELIQSGDTGLLTPVRDVGRLAAAMERVLRDPALRAALAGHGLNHYRHRYSEQKTLDATLDFYRRVQRRLPTRGR
jgi:L-malate glycosyltransferase